MKNWEKNDDDKVVQHTNQRKNKENNSHSNIPALISHQFLGCRSFHIYRPGSGLAIAQHSSHLNFLVKQSPVENSQNHFDTIEFIQLNKVLPHHQTVDRSIINVHHSISEDRPSSRQATTNDTSHNIMSWLSAYQVGPFLEVLWHQSWWNVQLFGGEKGLLL